MNSRDRLFWTEFLQLYRSMPAVWKVKSPEYSSRSLKTAGYEQLVLKLREVEPHADRALVVKKINSFRTNFRRDLRKREQCDAEREPFESTLWYFELLGFLEGQEESCHKAASSSPEQEVPPDVLQYNPCPARKRRLAVKDELPDTPAARATQPHASATHSPTAHRQRKRFSSLSASEALAHTWRTQFDEMPKQQQLLAGKLISDVLYFGCTEQLKSSHVPQLQQMMLQDCNPNPQLEELHSRTNYNESDTDG